DAILLAFLDLESDQEALLVRIVFRQRGNDLHVGETVLEVVTSNQVAVGFDAVGIVDVVAAEETQQVRLVRLDHVLEAVGRIGRVADELDGIDAGLLALVDREDQIDAVVGLLDDFGDDRHVIAAGVTIDIGDSLGIRLDHRTRQRSARFGLNFGRELLVLDLLVAFENDAANDRILDHRDDDSAAGLVDFHVLEQAGFDQALQAVVDMALIQLSIGAGLEIRADLGRLDPAIALDLDRIHRLRPRRRRREPNRERSSKRRRQHDQGGEQAPPYPHSNLHAPSALTILCRSIEPPRTGKSPSAALLVANFA